VISVSAFYLLKKRHWEFAQTSLKIGLSFALFASFFQLFTGHQSAIGVSENQPVKLAAFEAHYDSNRQGDLYLFGWVDNQNQLVKAGVKFPGMLSYLLFADANKPLIGLNSFALEDRPPVNPVFQSYHLMVLIGSLLILISLLSIYFLWWKSLFTKSWFLKILIFSVLGPQIANQLGWFSAEVGRQPWIVYGLMRTSDGLSKTVSAGQTLFSLILFTLIYLLLFILFIFLLDQKIKHGPEDYEEIAPTYQ
jgi:cytochrome d ubiquinol oxidase subunit I